MRANPGLSGWQGFSRRRMLQMIAAGTLASTSRGYRSGRFALADVASSPVQWLTEHVGVFRGTIHVGLLRHGQELVLIDCGDGEVFAWAEEEGLKVRQVLVTHHHWEQVCGLENAEPETEIVVPEAEMRLFTSPQDYWNAAASRWHIYNQHPHHWTPSEPLNVTRTVGPDDKWTWGPATVSVIGTPGHTDGALSYCIEVDNHRVVFCGDVLFRAGQFPDLYCLQKGFQRGQRRISDYHGYLGARDLLTESLRRILAVSPDVLVTSHGGVVEKPAEAVDLAIARLETLYDNYVSTSALRHYFPELFAEFQGRADHVPIQPTKEVPGYLRHIGTSWILLSREGAAFVMDCGSPAVITAVEKMLAAGDIKSVDGLWITHYHDDHVNAAPQFLEKFSCPCYAVESVADVITRPLAWRLPCISPAQVRVDHILADGSPLDWREYRMVAYEFPGQTLYHGALYVENGDDRLLFVGDSFTPAGIDDYCIQNRNFLHEGMGFRRCLELAAKLQPTHMFNCHVDQAFQLPPSICATIGERLEIRRRLCQEILPWPEPHFGMDEFWLRCDPYEQTAAPGDSLHVRVVVFNHLSQEATFHVRLVAPRSWRRERVPLARPSWTTWPRITAPARKESALELSLAVPPDLPPGRHVLRVDVALPKDDEAAHILMGFAEAVVVIPPAL